MPSKVRYMSWNIQNFGQGTPFYKICKGMNSSALCETIAAIVRTESIDILGIMEIQPNSLSHLDNLLFALNNSAHLNPVNQWCYDWIPGAVAATTAVGPVTHLNQLSWKSGPTSPRQEGYAIFWKNEHPGFQMLKAAQPMSQGTVHKNTYTPPHPISNCLSLSIQGRELQPNGNRPMASEGLEYKDPNKVYSHYSYYPDVSWAANPLTYHWSDTRRPAYCIIKLNIPNVEPSNCLCPIYMYHAPSGPNASKFGTYISGLGQELYAVRALDSNGVPNGRLMNSSMVIASGDYNVDPSEDNWNNYYQSYWHSVVGRDTDGARCTSVYNYTDSRLSATTIQLNEFSNGGFNGSPITNKYITAYEKSPIDNIFYRIPEGYKPKGYIYFFDRYVQGDENIYNDLFKNYYDPYMNYLIKDFEEKGFDIDPKKGPYNPHDSSDDKYTFKFMNNWNVFIKNIKSGKMTDARAAAEFTRMFVSDHLPLVFEFTVP